VIDQNGSIIYDGKISFMGTGPFEVINTIISGPFINILNSNGVTISFETSEKSICEIEVDNMIFKDKTEVTQHEIEISGLEPDTRYSYTIRYGEPEQSYTFKTSPLPGTRKRFIFSYSSDSRGGSGWGERNLYGANVYMIKKIMAVSTQYEVAFAQFTGDLISGYLTSGDEMLLQYHNWKNCVAPFAHYFQVTMSMGNHESYNFIFEDTIAQYKVSIDKFPYDNESSEALFASVSVNPHNGPESEDGSNYDPDPEHNDFPSYDENVFYYTYDNVAIVCLNSNYWYTPSTFFVTRIGGNIHGYVMDNQLKWFKKTLRKFEKDPTIDHVFVTIHTPFFPNGGHVSDDMWYSGHNTYRPWIAGQPVKEGIIERRDQLLDLAINQSDKVVAFLTGDEHNYCKTELGPATQIYPDEYKGKQLKLKRTIYQIN
ncbi:MAG: metallophosphoesterase family protein, partial [Bacteroidales bacterium]|nr:metallophosphoesterase family protein [Bacteroidales bacterium]